MRSIPKITATLLLTALTASAAMGQDFRQRSDNSSSFNKGDGFPSRRSDSNPQSDSSGYGRPDSSSHDSGSRDNGSGQSSFGSRDSGLRSSNSFSPTMPKSSGAFVAKPLPPDLIILTSRSIFSRDHRAVAAASDRPSGPPIFKSDVAKLIFRGAMLENDHYLAFIEDSGNSRPPQWVSIGQALTANGAQINDITLDHIVVEKSGTVRQIGVGENLDSGTRLPSPPASASLNSSASSAGTSLSGARPNSTSGTGGPTAATASTTGTATDEDVADMMRRRRVQELGQ
jgi:hypothetical protein